MSSKKFFVFLSVAGSLAFAWGSGFALYEPSAPAHALGGALLGKAVDPSANFINPATLSDITNLTVTLGFVTEHPRCKVRVNNWPKENLDPGPFLLPHFMMAIPLPYGFTFGLGGDAEYGLGTKYSNSWSMNWSTTETTVQGYVLTPNIAYEITEDWSVGAGLRWLYFDFEQYANPHATDDALPGQNLGTTRNHLHGDNDFRSVGWQIGTRYKILDNLSVGAVYKSAIDVHVKGDCETRLTSVNPPYLALYDVIEGKVGKVNGDADAKLTLPQSITGGFNWDITDTVHFGAAVSWTEWSKLDHLKFNLPTKIRDVELKWHDTWRYSFGAAWDFAKDWTFMISYIYDMDCTDRHQKSAMLPPADRHILGGGLSWRIWRGLECTLSYACIFMDGGTMSMNDELGTRYTLKSMDGFCHAAGFSVTYRF